MNQEANNRLMLTASKAPDGSARIVACLGERELVKDTCDLWNEEDRRRLADAIHEKVPALPMERIETELMGMAGKDLPSIDEQADVWESPEPVDRPALAPFPTEYLPRGLRGWVESATHAFQVPSELPGLLALAACSGMVARRIEISPSNGWIEPLNLFVAVLLEPANRKSAVFRAAFAPVRTIEKETVETARPEVAKLQSERRIKEKQLAALEKKIAEGRTEDLATAEELAIELAQSPTPRMPKLIVDDTSSEAVENELADQNGRIIVSGCEGGLFDVMAGRYSGGVNLDVFLKGHAGDDLRVDRLARKLFVERCCLTLAYAVQPDVIHGLAQKPSFRGRGLIGRFLFAFPANVLGRRQIDTAPIPESVSQQYEHLIRQLHHRASGVQDCSCILTLAPDANDLFRDWQREVESMLGDAGRLADLRDWGGKLCGLTARIAGLLHLIDHCQLEAAAAIPVHHPSMAAAIQLARWSVDHAEAVIGMMGADCEPLNDAAYVLRWIRARGEPRVTRHEIGQHGRARFTGAQERLDKCMVALTSRGWLRQIENPAPGPGRPSTVYEVNPAALEPQRNVAPSSAPMRIRGTV